jgi:hypothetical protein
MERLSKRRTGLRKMQGHLLFSGDSSSHSWRHGLAPNSSEPKTSAPVAEVLSDHQERKSSMTLGNFALNTLLSRCYCAGRPTHPKHFKQSFRCGGR